MILNVATRKTENKSTQTAGWRCFEIPFLLSEKASSQRVMSQKKQTSQTVYFMI